MSETSGSPPRKKIAVGKPTGEKQSAPAPLLDYCGMNDDSKRDILACELLDTEHDLNRQAGQVSPLYLYTYHCLVTSEVPEKRHIWRGRFTGPFRNQTLYKEGLEKLVYTCGTRFNTMSPRKVATSMKYILDKTGDVEYETIKTGKNINALREYVGENYNVVNPMVVETIKGGTDPMDDVQSMTNIRRSDLSNRFDNNCLLISLPGLLITVADTIGDPVGDGDTDFLQSTRIYPNHFPEAASVFVYKSELKSERNIVAKILGLISQCSTSILPINIQTSTSINSSLAGFIHHVNSIIASDNDNAVYLLHIFRNMKYTDDPNESVVTNTEIDGYNFSLQREQITLNEVTQQMGWGTKRGCLGSAVYADIDESKMIFSEGITPFMRNCHAAYGKLCGDGVTAYVISEYYKRTGINIPAILSIDEFCCLRTNIAIKRWWSSSTQLTIASFQQKPTSKLSGFGGGFLYANRTTEVITINKDGVSRNQLEFDKKIQLLRIAENELITAINSFRYGNITITNEEDATQNGTFISVITEDIFDVLLGNISKYLLDYINHYRDSELIISNKISDDYTNSIESIPEENKDEIIGKTIGRIIDYTNLISKVTNFYEQYIIALVSLSQVTLPNSIGNNERSSRHSSGQTETIINNFFGRLGDIEKIFDEAGIEQEQSRIHITYIIITKVFTNPDFTNNLIGLIVNLFTNPDVLELKNNKEGWVNGPDQHTIVNYQDAYDSLKRYHDEMKPTARLSKQDAAIKIKIRRNLIILKYLIRALSAGYYAVRFPFNPQSAAVGPSTFTLPTEASEPHATYQSQELRDTVSQKRIEVLNADVNTIIDVIQESPIYRTFYNIDKAYFVVTKDIINLVLTPLRTPGAEIDDNYDPETLMSMLEYDSTNPCVAEEIKETSSATSSATLLGGRKGGTRRKRRSRKPKRTRKGLKTGSKVKTRRRRRNHKKKRKTRTRSTK